MKKALSMLLICVLLVGTVLTLTSCGTILFGTYTSEMLHTTYEFGFNKVTRTVEVFGDNIVEEGTYEISGDEGERKITFTFDGDVETYNFSEGSEDGVKYVKIGVIKYTKAD